MDSRLRFGIGGIPHTAKGDMAAGIRRVAELGLEHTELEFVHSVFLTEEKAPKIKKVSEASDVTLTVHGSYFTNFAATDKKKWHASIGRIAKAAHVGALAGAHSITYHSGFFQGKSFAEVEPLVLEAMIEIFKDMEKRGVETRISPELTGKPSQIGDLEELISIVNSLRAKGYEKVVGLCIDFSHKYARSDGRYNTYDEFMEVIDKLASELGEETIKQLHIHISGIEHSPKGEKNHLTFFQSLEEYAAEGVSVDGIEAAWKEIPENKRLPNKFNWRELLKALKKAGVGGFVVCESPILELDALLMQKFYQSL